MSLICVQCGKIIILSNNPDHYGNCHRCPVEALTEEQKKLIRGKQTLIKLSDDLPENPE
jgi:DNA-directed RNA polymerase subunit RPC12/RpoP